MPRVRSHSRHDSEGFKSEPLIAQPRSSNSPASDFIPEPQMPTKWAAGRGVCGNETTFKAGETPRRGSARSGQQTTARPAEYGERPVRDKEQLQGAMSLYEVRGTHSCRGHDSFNFFRSSPRSRSQAACRKSCLTTASSLATASR